MAAAGITVRLRKDSTARPPSQVYLYGSQNYAELKRQCLQQGRLFTDPAFGPCPESLGYHELGPGSEKTQRVVWKRPKDICKPRTPYFIRENMSRTDVCQGQLGDCWFLAAAASLTLYRRLLYRVVPRDQSFDAPDYAGIFHFQFWHYGQWVDVVVDDFLPTKDGTLLFVRSTESDEFWMPLLEKAYAKLNGSYEAMNGGFMNEAFVDFTGGIGVTFSLKTPNPSLFEAIKASLSKRSLMGAYIEVKSRSDMEANTPEGLVKGHAYSITGLHNLELGQRNIRLLRLRNPWGRVEWNGRWSDRSPLWDNLDPALQRKLRVKREDGEFWMELIDFLHHFDFLEICHLNADWLEEGSPVDWNINCFQGSWVKGHTAGGHRNIFPWDTFWMNPQFHVLLLEPDAAELKKKERKDATCTLLVSLTQRDRRRERKMGRDFLDICLDIFQVPEEVITQVILTFR